MIFNKLNLSEGDVVNLDITHPNTSKVKIIEIAPMGMISTVTSIDEDGNPIDEEWDVMTSRLTN